MSMQGMNEKLEQIAALIGQENAVRLCREFAGETVYFPKNVLIYLEHEEIRKEYKEGASYRDLSIKYGRTTRQIREIIHTYEHLDFDKDQPTLF